MTALRMKDVVEQTGTSREAIRFYINEGLLPEPRKTSRNMAWYSPEHVERIRYIKALQEEHFLPLKAIRAVLNGDGAEFTSHQQHQFEVLRTRLRAEHRDDRALPVDDVIAKFQLTAEDREAASALGFLDAHDQIGPDGVELLRLWSGLREQGLTLARGFSAADVQIVQDAVDVLFAHELKLFTERLGDMSDEEIEHIQDRIIPGVNRAFALLHERKLRQFLEQLQLNNNGVNGDDK